MRVHCTLINLALKFVLCIILVTFYKLKKNDRIFKECFLEKFKTTWNDRIFYRIFSVQSTFPIDLTFHLLKTLVICNRLNLLYRDYCSTKSPNSFRVLMLMVIHESAYALRRSVEVSCGATAKESKFTATAGATTLPLPSPLPLLTLIYYLCIRLSRQNPL